MNFKKIILVFPVMLILLLFPLPAALLDTLMIINIISAVFILLITICTRKVIYFSLFPTILLVLLSFNLIIHILFTRLILNTGADFDDRLILFIASFMSDSNGILGLVVGSVIFIAVFFLFVLIIIKQTDTSKMWIARFYLEGLPARQMAIDAEYSNGDMSIEELTTEKNDLRKKVNFYGALDGVLEFISNIFKGMFFITGVSIISGILIGTKLHSEDLITAAGIYIPLSVAAGCFAQLTLVLKSIAMGIITSRLKPILKPVIKNQNRCRPHSWIPPTDHLTLELGFDLIPLVDRYKGAEFLERFQGRRRQIALDMGINVPRIRIIDKMQLEPNEYCLKIRGVDVCRGNIRMGYFLCIYNDGVKNEIPGEKTHDTVYGKTVLWVTADRRDEAERAGYTVVAPPSIIATHLTEAIKHHAAEILGRQDTYAILDTIKKDFPELADKLLEYFTLGQIQKVLQNLLKEQISIRNMSKIMETMVEYGSTTQDLVFITEKAKQALNNNTDEKD